MLNGGTVWQPYVVSAITDATGNRDDTAPVAENEVDLDPATVRQLKQDLQQVVNRREGTAFSAFEDFGDGMAVVGGKTGTAEVIKSTVDEDGNFVPSVTTALFVGAAPINNPEYVVVIIVERGGSGGQIAAPMAKQILQYLLNGPEAITPISLGEDSER
jgi:cell division protein FtsI/penicillin-binding protein 2